MPSIYKYKRHITQGPNGTTLYFRNTDEDPRGFELCEIDGWWYVTIPDGMVIPEQRPEINWQIVDLTAETKDQIKSASKTYQRIHQEFLDAVRDKYSLDDELYYARISIGAIQGTYTLIDNEQQELIDYQIYVESVRAIKRNKLAELGL